MSLQTVSTKRNRVYERAFDHDEARQLREADPKTWTHKALAAHFGVSTQAVKRVLDEPMTTFIVLCRNGDGWKEHGEIEAATARAAVEQAAADPGDYIAVSAKQVFHLEPVTTLKVVRG